MRAQMTIFDRQWRRYDRWYVKNKFAYLSELAAVKSMLPKNDKGVEIGVGTGRFAEPLGIRWGLEPSQNMAACARKRGIRVVIGKAECLPFANDSFDYALMVTTLCFLEDVKRVFKEAQRVIRYKGSFIVGFIDKNSLLGKQYHAYKNESVFYREATLYSAKAVIELFLTTGFTDIKAVQTLFKPLSDLVALEPIKKGAGAGSFVVIRGINRWGGR